MTLKQFPTVVSIASTDSGGGAGIQADIKALQSQHVFSTNVIVGVTAQNTYTVQAVYPLPKHIIDAQFASLAQDFDIRAVKTGALLDAEHVAIVANNLKKYRWQPIVIDPVMVAKGGAVLLSEAGQAALIHDLLPLAELITPNLPEAELLVKHPIRTPAEITAAAREIQALGAKNVLIKGGHTDGKLASDYLLLADQSELWLTAEHVQTERTHGTGDTLSSVIIAQLALGQTMAASVRIAKDYLTRIIHDPIIIGHGHGPLNHWA